MAAISQSVHLPAFLADSIRRLLTLNYGAGDDEYFHIFFSPVLQIVAYRVALQLEQVGRCGATICVNLTAYQRFISEIGVNALLLL